eukprot:1154511-Pelagomonas_calceolata.AAC.1
MKEGAEMDCPLQAGHLCFLRRVLGVKRSTCNLSVLCECGQEPLQFYRELVRKVLKTDRAWSAALGVKCWTAEILESFNGLEKHEHRLGREWRNWTVLSQGGTAISGPLDGFSSEYTDSIVRCLSSGGSN